MSEEQIFDKWLISSMPSDIDYLVHTEEPVFICKFGVCPTLLTDGFNTPWKSFGKDILYDLKIYGDTAKFWEKHDELLEEAQQAILNYYRFLEHA